MHTPKAIGLFSLGLLAILLAACGGGGSGSTPPPSSITLTVEDPASSFSAAAYQVGSGSWQPLTMTGTTTKTATFSLAGQSKYGVAVRCSGPVVKVIQATAGELPNPKVVCSTTTPTTVSFTVNVNVDPSLFAGGDSVCVNGSNCQPAGSSVAITANLEAGTQDLLVTLGNNSDLVKVAKVVRGVNVSSGGSTSVSLAPGDQLTPVSFTLASAPTGYTATPAALVFYLSANITANYWVNTSPTSYRPVSGFGSGDRYVALSFATGSNATLVSLQSFTGTPSLAFPAPWTAGSLSVTQNAHPSISGLSRIESDLQGYWIHLQLTAQLDYTAILSKGWLGSATGYTLPDLSSQLGYASPASGSSGTLSISAILANKPILQLDSSDLSSLLSSLVAGDYVQEAVAKTTSYNVGGGTINLP